MRRLRASEPIRNLVRETSLEPSAFVLPLFVCPGEGVRRPISAMPGNCQLSIDQLVQETVGFHQRMLLGPRQDMDDIANAIAKIYENRRKLKEAG